MARATGAGARNKGNSKSVSGRSILFSLDHLVLALFRSLLITAAPLGPSRTQRRESTDPFPSEEASEVVAAFGSHSSMLLEATMVRQW
jgi:hypothetical protein